MKCRDCFDFILRYLEGELPPDEHASFELHISRCPPCQRYLDQYRVTVRAGKTACADEHTAPGTVPEELVRAILDSRKA